MPARPKKTKAPPPEPSAESLLKVRIAELETRLASARRERKMLVGILHRTTRGAPPARPVPRTAISEAVPTADEILKCILKALRGCLIMEEPEPDREMTADFVRCDREDEKTGDPGRRMHCFMSKLEKCVENPTLSPSELLDGIFATPRELAEAL